MPSTKNSNWALINKPLEFQIKIQTHQINTLVRSLAPKQCKRFMPGKLPDDSLCTVGLPQVLSSIAKNYQNKIVAFLKPP